MQGYYKRNTINYAQMASCGRWYKVTFYVLYFQQQSPADAKISACQQCK